MLKIPILIGMMFMSIFALNGIEDVDATSCVASENFPIVIVEDTNPFEDEFGNQVFTSGTCKKLLSFQECVAHGESTAYCGSFSYQEFDIMGDSGFVPSVLDSSVSGHSAPPLELVLVALLYVNLPYVIIGVFILLIVIVLVRRRN